jgi:hypothetical protein
MAAAAVSSLQCGIDPFMLFAMTLELWRLIQASLSPSDATTKNQGIQSKSIMQQVCSTTGSNIGCQFLFPRDGVTDLSTPRGGGRGRSQSTNCQAGQRMMVFYFDPSVLCAVHVHVHVRSKRTRRRRRRKAAAEQPSEAFKSKRQPHLGL